MVGPRVTTNHEEIRQWVEDRGGRPVLLHLSGISSSPSLSIIFSDSPSPTSSEELTWDDFFSKFDEQKLAFLYQDFTSDGAKSKFAKFITQT
jgi:hypothetical protein